MFHTDDLRFQRSAIDLRTGIVSMSCDITKYYYPLQLSTYPYVQYAQNVYLSN